MGNKSLFGGCFWPKNPDPRVKGPQPRIISFEAALEIRRRQREAQKNGEDGPSVVFKDK